MIQEVYDFLKTCRTYYLATVDGDQARVRPFGTVDIFDGRLTIQTGRSKDVAKQMLIGTATAISEIAARLAFPSAAAFSRLFERCAGCSPADYRHC